MGWWDVIKNVAPIAGAAASGAAEGKKSEAELQNQQDAIRLRGQESLQDALLRLMSEREQGIVNRGNLDLQQRKYALAAPDAKTSQVMRGDLLSNVQDVSVNRPAGIPVMKFTGGLRPSALGESSRLAGKTLAEQALASLQAGEKFDTPAMQEAPILPMFQTTPLPKSSWWQKALGALGTIGSMAGAAKDGYSAGQGSGSMPRYDAPGTYDNGSVTVSDYDPSAPTYGSTEDWWNDYLYAQGVNGQVPSYAGGSAAFIPGQFDANGYPVPVDPVNGPIMPYAYMNDPMYWADNPV